MSKKNLTDFSEKEPKKKRMLETKGLNFLIFGKLGPE